ncbi:TrmH family RNA methyltransferase [Nonomuraea sp. NPDC050556]|uniref:TrmH family RNA methyltransferase n=1 Tax=Nonomuraea sp. NPDC050556 TaxID=3364369 RepID=UPI00379FD6B0
MPEYLTDPRDPRLADYTSLRDVELRKSLEAERGLFLAEGEKVIRRAVGSGYPVRSVLTTERWLASLSDVLDGCTVYVVDEAVMEGVAGFQVHRGALASMERLPVPPVPDVLATATRVVVLEDIVDHTNVGAIFRCAAALGVDAVILSPRCADPLYRRSVKVSMGAVFAVPYARMDDWYGGLDTLRSAGFQTLALTPDQGATPLDEVKMGSHVALLMGSEGPGLSPRWLNEASERVCIPMSATAMASGVDSLNVVAATAIACHTLMRG